MNCIQGPKRRNPSHRGAGAGPDKTNWRLSSQAQTGSTGKILWPNLENLYQDYLQRHRPVLVRNLGVKARYDLTFSAEAHLERCFTLFPGLWDDSQKSAFHAKLILPVLGCGERATRIALSKALSPANAAEGRTSRGIHPASIHQTLHHSAKIHDEVYLRGSCNAANCLQADVLGWS